MSCCIKFRIALCAHGAAAGPWGWRPGMTIVVYNMCKLRACHRAGGPESLLQYIMKYIISSPYNLRAELRRDTGLEALRIERLRVKVRANGSAREGRMDRQRRANGSATPPPSPPTPRAHTRSSPLTVSPLTSFYEPLSNRNCAHGTLWTVVFSPRLCLA